MTKLDDLFIRVADEMRFAKLVAWDGCHKIYLAMDETEAEWFQSEYEYVFRGTAEQMTEMVREWYEKSCGLRFVQAVHHTPHDPNEGYISIISQFDDYEEESEEF